MLQILVVCSNNAERLLLVETFQHCFGYRSANLGFRTATELVDKDETAFVAVFHHYLHIGQVRGVGAEVIFDRLLVADVNEYIAEYAGMATFVHRDEQAALQHVLQQPYSFQADRLSAGVGTGDDENTLFFVQLYIQRYNFFPMFGKRELQQRMYRHCPVYNLLVFKSRFQSGDLLGKQGLGTYEIYFGKKFI